MVDDLDGDSAGGGLVERAGCVAVQRGPGFGVDLGLEGRFEGVVRVVHAPGNRRGGGLLVGERFAGVWDEELLLGGKEVELRRFKPLEDKGLPRLSDLSEVLFPVEEHPVFVSIREPDGERRILVPEKKAIVDGKKRRVLGIVSRGYRLVTNQEALD